MRERHIRARTRSTAQLPRLLSQVALEAASDPAQACSASLGSQRFVPWGRHAPTQGTATGPPVLITSPRRIGAPPRPHDPQTSHLPRARPAPAQAVRCLNEPADTSP
jgi:hypothetical protein